MQATVKELKDEDEEDAEADAEKHLGKKVKGSVKVRSLTLYFSCKSLTWYVKSTIQELILTLCEAGHHADLPDPREDGLLTFTKMRAGVEVTVYRPQWDKAAKRGINADFVLHVINVAEQQLKVSLYNLQLCGLPDLPLRRPNLSSVNYPPQIFSAGSSMLLRHNTCNPFALATCDRSTPRLRRGPESMQLRTTGTCVSAM